MFVLIQHQLILKAIDVGFLFRVFSPKAVNPKAMTRVKVGCVKMVKVLKLGYISIFYFIVLMNSK